MLKELLKEFKSIDVDQMRLPGFLQKREDEIKVCVDNVTNGKGLKNIDKCPLCGETKREFIFARFGINAVKCSGCGTGYMEKFPVDSGDVYRNDDYTPIAKSDYLDNVKYRQERFGKERIEILQKYLKKESKESRLLDVGCGTGWFLDLAQQYGFRVAGQEFSTELSRFTAERLGIQVWSDPITEIPVNEKFDAITLFDVIEHVPNPVAVIESIKEHLNKDGIALFFTPNLDSLGFWKLKERSSLVMPVEHLFYFTEKSLRMVFEKVGLEVEYFAAKGMDVPDLFSHYRDDLKNEAVADFLKENSDVLQAIIDASGKANHLRFIVRKK